MLASTHKLWKRKNKNLVSPLFYLFIFLSMLQDNILGYQKICPVKCEWMTFSWKTIIIAHHVKQLNEAWFMVHIIPVDMNIHDFYYKFSKRISKNV